MIFGCRSMDIVRRPLCGCFVLSCMVGGIFRKPLGFRRCLPPARTEKALPFQAGQGPCTKHRQTVRLCLYAPKKVFEGSKGRFFKNAPLAGCGTASRKERESQPIGARLFRGETQEKADLTGMVKFAILYTRDEWITHNKKRMQFFLREGKKSEQAV